MDEWGLVWSFLLKLIPAALFSLCYMIGGRTSKWVRRYIGPILFVASNAILAQVFGMFSWKIAVLLVYVPILTFPYSKDFERLIYVSALTAAAIFAGIIFNSPLGYLQAVFTFSTGLFFTINHPIPAVNEEGIISFSSVFLITYMVT